MSESTTTTRLFPYPSPTKASSPFWSKEIFVTREKCDLLLESTPCPASPTCIRKRPSRVNLRMWESPWPFPPIQMLSMGST